MKKSIFVLIAMAVSLSACMTTIAINGRMERSDETFVGTLSGSGYSGGKGELVIVSNRHATCRGSFVYTSRRRGEGVLDCDDGRTGPFRVVGISTSGGTTGSGSGELSGHRYTFTFDEPK